jgi:hypothetical protein
MSSAVLQCSNAVDVDAWLERCFSALRQKLEHFLRMFLSKLCTWRHMFEKEPVYAVWLCLETRTQHDISGCFFQKKHE